MSSLDIINKKVDNYKKRFYFKQMFNLKKRYKKELIIKMNKNCKLLKIRIGLEP